MTQVHGQHDERAQRVANTRRWLNAIALSATGEPVPLADKVDWDLVPTLVDIVRQAYEQGIKQIQLDEPSAATVHAVLAALPPEIRACVITRQQQQTQEETPISPVVEQRQEPRPRRDIIRTSASVENGTLRPIE